MFCGMCGTELSKDAMFCPVCGAPVEAIEDENREIVDPGPAGSFVSEQKRICKSCGAELEEDDAFCGNCGAPVEKTGPIPPTPESPDPWPISSAPMPESPDPWPISQAPSGPISPEPTKSSAHKSSIDPLERHELVIVTRDELTSGCQKAVEVDGKIVVVDIPPYYNTGESMYFKGCGYTDEATGRQGDLKVDFMVS